MEQIEIERKFRVTGDGYREAADGYAEIQQGFLAAGPERTVRVRVSGDCATLTIKGPSDAQGLARSEWEYEIPVAEARSLIDICLPGVIEKRRYRVPVAGGLFEVDEFAGANEGLVVAEIELPSRAATVPRPSWLGREVTGQTRYYNARLAERPYADWSEKEREAP